MNLILRALRKLVSLVTSHIGSGDKAHSLATSKEAGFISPSEKTMIDMRCRYAKTLENGTGDVLTLPMGLYISRSFKNQPSNIDDSLVLVEISGADNGNYKRIDIEFLNMGYSYTRFIYGGGTYDSGWNIPVFENMTLEKGWTGFALIKKTRLGCSTLVEIKFEADKTTDFSNGETFCVIPGNMSMDNIVMYTPISVFPPNGAPTDATLSINGGRNMRVWKNATTSDVKKIAGSLIYTTNTRWN